MASWDVLAVLLLFEDVVVLAQDLVLLARRAVAGCRERGFVAHPASLPAGFAVSLADRVAVSGSVVGGEDRAEGHAAADAHGDLRIPDRSENLPALARVGHPPPSLAILSSRGTFGPRVSLVMGGRDFSFPSRPPSLSQEEP